jgi:hypothetical protein
MDKRLPGATDTGHTEVMYGSFAGLETVCSFRGAIANGGEESNREATRAV